MAQVCQGLTKWVEMELYCEKHERMDSVLRCVFVDNELSVGYVARRGFVQRERDSHGIRESAQRQTTSRSVHLK